MDIVSTTLILDGAETGTEDGSTGCRDVQWPLTVQDMRISCRQWTHGRNQRLGRPAGGASSTTYKIVLFGKETIRLENKMEEID